MYKKRSMKKPDAGIAKGIGISLIVSIIVTILGTFLTAHLIHKEIISESSVTTIAVIVLSLSSAAGAFSAICVIKKMRLQISLLSGGVYMLLLLSMTALFFGGQYESVITSMLAVLGGCGVVAFAYLIPKGKGKRNIRKNAYR